jgi:hypothetical protein
LLFNAHINKDIKLIGDFVSGHELADTMGLIHVERFKYTAVPKWLICLSSRDWQKTISHKIIDSAMSDMANLTPLEIDKCKAINPDLMSMEQYLKLKGWDNCKLLGSTVFDPCCYVLILLYICYYLDIN